MSTEKRTPWHDTRDWLVRRYGTEIGEWLARRIGRQIVRLGKDEMACSDNFRTADASDADAMTRYRAAQAEGCCGSFDHLFHHYKSDRKIWIGFNYGH